MRLTLALPLILAVMACGGSSDGDRRDARPRTKNAPDASAECPPTRPAAKLLPGVEAQHRTLAYWLEHTPALDEVLLSSDRIDEHNRLLSEPRWDGKPLAWNDLTAPVDPAALKGELEERLGMMRERIASGEYVDARGERLSAEAAAPFAIPDPLPAATPTLQVALADVQLRCGPRKEGLYKLPVDLRFNRNNCSTAGPQEPIRVLFRWPNGPRFVKTRHAFGWIDDDAALSPPIDEAAAWGITRAPMVEMVRATTLTAGDGATFEAPPGILLSMPNMQNWKVKFATAAGLHESGILPRGAARRVPRDLTRRAVLEEAFARLDEPYGWGGEAGGLDCSGFVLDVFSSFGLQLPRDSGRQALAGTDVIAVDAGKSETERLALIDEAAGRGVVLLHFPGHIMLYLGRDERRTPMAIHAFAEYLEPCRGGGETLRTVTGVTVSDLTLGKDTTRKAFLQRITKIVVLGRPTTP